MEKELLIIGNGFDLQCGLKTRYKDFFFDRYGVNLVAERLKVEDNNSENIQFSKYQIEAENTIIALLKEIVDSLDIDRLLQNKSNANGYLVNYFLQKLRKNGLLENDLKIEFTNWDVIFLVSYVLMKRNLYWNDVEKAIFDVTSLVLKFDQNEFSDCSFVSKSDKDKFKKIVRYCFKENRKDVASAMLDALKKFEKQFAKYIRKQMHEHKREYLSNVTKLLKKITFVDDTKSVELDVINFNYSLDEYTVHYLEEQKAISNISVNSWVNIHGIAYWNNSKVRTFLNRIHGRDHGALPAPIFGIDGHDILSPSENKILDLDDPRIIFTKSYRLIDSRINTIRDKEHKLPSTVNKIIFYGHSLGHADYSYFETLFDLYKLFDSDVELDFYYHSHNQRLKNRKSEQNMLKQVVNLLTSYGETLPNQHGENIVNRLVLEQRLNLFPTSKC